MSIDCMTPEQRKFSEDHHGLFLKFLGQYQLDEEYYTILVGRYLDTVIKYCERPELQQYAFSTILWRNLRSELHNELRKRSREPVTICEDVYLPPVPEFEPLDEALWQQLEDDLTQKQIETMLLRNQGYSNHEIAGICGVTLRAIERRFNRIRRVVERNNAI